MTSPILPWLGCLILVSSSVSLGSAMADQNDVSDLKSDERVVFFPADAYESDQGETCRIRIHAWVHEYERATLRKATIAAALRTRYGLQTTAATKANFDRRIRLLVADNEGDKRIVIQLAGRRFALPKTGPDGHTRGTIELDVETASEHATDGQLVFTAVLPRGDDRSFSGIVRLIPRRGISVISDFDDTVKVTEVTNRTAMLDNSLYKDYQAVAGMADLYTSWAESGAVLHFVSSSPWHLYEPMDEFLTASGFPSRSMSLKVFRFKDKTLMNLFQKGTVTKPMQIHPIIESYPERRFVLVGDSGEQDPEVYAAVMKRYPQQVDRVYIRNITQASPQDDRFGKLLQGLDPAKWVLFDDPAELTLPN